MKIFGKAALMFILALVMGMAFIGCSTDGSEEAGETEEYRQVPDRQALNSNDRVLGWGYDITGEYAKAESIRWQVLDFTQLDAAGKIKLQQLQPMTYKLDAGSTSTEYQTSMANNIGVTLDASYNAASFSAEVTHAFSSSRSSSDAYTFATVRMVVPKRQYVIDGTVSQLIPYLSEGFLYDLNHLTPEEFIRDYGTHVMLGGSWGGRVDYNSSFQKRAQVTQDEVSNFVKIKAGATFGIGKINAELSTEDKNALSSKFESNSESKNVIIWGGNDSGGLMIANENDYTQWVASLSDSSSWIWYDFYGNNNLRPITDFITDTEKKAAVTQALTAYYTSKKINVNPSGILTAGSRNGTFPVNNFNQTGGGHRIGGGDSDINSKSGRQTTWNIDLTFTPQGQNVIMNYTYKVREGAKNNTEIAITGSRSYAVSGLPSGTSVHSVSHIYGSGTIKDKHHDWVGVQVSGLSDVSVKIDGSGDDEGNVGFKFNGNIPYTY
jgi:hypothetical protein